MAGGCTDPLPDFCNLLIPEAEAGRKTWCGELGAGRPVGLSDSPRGSRALRARPPPAPLSGTWLGPSALGTWPATVAAPGPTRGSAAPRSHHGTSAVVNVTTVMMLPRRWLWETFRGQTIGSPGAI